MRRRCRRGRTRRAPTIRSSALISTRPNTSVRNASGPRSWSEKRMRARRRTRRSPRVAMTVDVMFVSPRSAIARMSAIWASRPCRTPAPTTRRRIVTGKVVGQDLRHGGPVAGREVRQEALGHSACSVFQSRSRLAQLIELRERGVDVCLVEDLAATDQVTFDSENVDHPPLGDEAPFRGPFQRLGDDGSEITQPMHSLDVDSDVRSEVQPGPNRCGQIDRLDRYERSMVDVHRIRCRWGNSCRLNAAQARVITDHVCACAAASPAM